MDADVSTTSLVLDETLSGRGMLDGGWWPHSTDPLVELPLLVAALNARVGTVFRIALSGDTQWQSTPRKIVVAGHTVKLGWFGPPDVHEISVSGAGRDRLDLLVVPPDTDSEQARAAMVVAADGANRSHGTAILEAQTRETNDARTGTHRAAVPADAAG